MSAAVEIRHIVQPHPITGLTNNKLGIWLFLASEVMLFGALFSSYVLLRVGNPTWHQELTKLNVPMATFNTLVLITSSITMVMAWASLMMDSFPKFRIYLGATILLGITFLVVKYFEYGEHLKEHELPSKSTFLGLYFTMTGLHVLHVIGGILVNAYLWGPGASLWKKDRMWFANRIECAGLYWHFVDLVWIFLFPVIYLLK